VIVFNIWFYFAYCVITIAAVLFFVPILIAVRVFSSRRKTMKLLRRAIAIYGKICMGLAWPYIRVEFRDLSNTDRNGPTVYICNHRSSSDPFLMAWLQCELVQVVNIWPFSLPILGPTARLAGYLSIREIPFEEFKEQASRLLQDGVSIVAFPEGTRTRDGNVGQFHGTLFRVCKETGSPIVPICIMGTEDKPPRGSLLMRPGVVRIHCLEALTQDKYKDMKPFNLKNAVRDAIISHIDREEGE
jgi:1-acyl-sn-glycerol-3-phosphate acyltransferase